ncbi:MAG: hypothetical protein E7256_04470 [Lachnospiraceae bacterium]|nr:hypothetical protein [Lachnospiraceae bacterium]
MTSKSLFTNLLKENMKHRIWTLVLSCLSFFFALPVSMAVITQNAKSSRYREYSDTVARIINSIGSESVLLIGITIVASIVCGIGGFSYLHSKKKVDFYHSLPLKREFLFSISYLNGIILYVIPYFISLSVSLLIIKSNGYMTKEIAAAAFIGFGIHTLFYSILYTFSVIAVLLTGNTLISLFACGTLFLYGPAIYFICTGMFENFFSYYSTAIHPERILHCLSPVTFYCDVITSNSYGCAYPNFSTGTFFITLLLLILSVAVAIFLYQKRPSEAAGKAIAFRVIEAPVKFLITIPVSLAAGLFGQNLITDGSFSWYLFGALCGFLLSYGIMEVIYHFDIRKAFAHKIQLIACGALTLVIIVLFKTDAFGYDSYLPKEDSIESMSVHFSSIDKYVDCYDTSSEKLSYMSAEEYALTHMELTDFSAAYEILKDYLAFNEENLSSSDYAYSTKGDWHTNLSVKYTLKSGRCVYRSYFINGAKYEDLIAQIYASAAYKEGVFPAFTMKADRIMGIDCNTVADTKTLTLSLKEKEELLSLYRQDLYELTLEDLKSSAPSAVLDIRLGFGDESYYISAYVYPSFLRTLSFLKEHGLDCMTTLDPERIIDLTIHQYSDKYYPSASDKYYPSASEEIASVSAKEKVLRFQDKKEIAQILPYLIPTNFHWGNDSLLEVTDNIEVMITYQTDDYGNETTLWFAFRKDGVPDFIMQELNK